MIDPLRILFAFLIGGFALTFYPITVLHVCADKAPAGSNSGTGDGNVLVGGEDQSGVLLAQNAKRPEIRGLTPSASQGLSLRERINNAVRDELNRKKRSAIQPSGKPISMTEQGVKGGKPEEPNRVIDFPGEEPGTISKSATLFEIGMFHKTIYNSINGNPKNGYCPPGTSIVRQMMWMGSGAVPHVFCLDPHQAEQWRRHQTIATILDSKLKNAGSEWEKESSEEIGGRWKTLDRSWWRELLECPNLSKSLEQWEKGAKNGEELEVDILKVSLKDKVAKKETVKKLLVSTGDKDSLKLEFLGNILLTLENLTAGPSFSEWAARLASFPESFLDILDTLNLKHSRDLDKWIVRVERQPQPLSENLLLGFDRLRTRTFIPDLKSDLVRRNVS
jgi:hypothetical protein